MPMIGDRSERPIIQARDYPRGVVKAAIVRPFCGTIVQQFVAKVWHGLSAGVFTNNGPARAFTGWKSEARAGVVQARQGVFDAQFFV